ncbi:MAG: thioredoxin reductase [Acidimicrobiia bacterium]|nr:MAG: thioredoxin reductase [Acidimicrobiia bacterium]
MASVVIVGDGPGGLSAALFLAKNGQQVTVFGQDKTAVHYAYLYNYLGIPEISGSDFQKTARDQVERHGAELVEDEVTSVEAGERFRVVTAEGRTVEADYLILTEGKNPKLARSLGLAETPEGAIAVDSECRSSLDRVYVVGRSIRPNRSQVVISAGDGAKAALDILAREEGKDVQDWDTPPKSS